MPLECRRHAVAVADNVQYSILGIGCGASSLSGFSNPIAWLLR